jgi:hypothetical protein
MLEIAGAAGDDDRGVAAYGCRRMSHDVHLRALSDEARRALRARAAQDHTGGRGHARLRDPLADTVRHMRRRTERRPAARERSPSSGGVTLTG